MNQNQKNRLLFTFFLIISLFYGYLSVLKLENSQLQFMIVSDIYQNSFANRDMQFISSIDYKYPNLNIFAMPLGAIKAAYLIENDSIHQAIKILHETKNHNPFLMFNEYQLSIAHARLNQRDSFAYYSHKAIKGLPNNPVHFLVYGKKLQEENKTDSLMYYFNKVDEKVKKRDGSLWKITLSSLARDSVAIEKYNGKELAKQAKELFKDDQINLVADMVLYSEKNIYAAMGKELIAMQNFNDGEIEESIKLFKESVELHPGNKKYYDGLVKAYYYSNQFEEVVDLYSYYLSNFVQVNAEVLYLFSVSLVNTGDNRGCDNIRIMSTNTNYQIDQKLLIACGYTL